ncbi:MAG: chemotaxis protein CheB [Aulosira sp. ZfuVER01]|nr:chemotaxis protein CheB [Aulosira sp. ZfuVER01]MDZ8000372.1 chemotaxis protein CheB [Aulosira sp. DedVER01a]MDZ8052845.1 chemotaxis protein CheB [Aulosira sp. ZfuCHP01]
MAVRSFTGESVSNQKILSRPYFELVAIGASLGGLNALTVLLGSLPKNFSVPIAVAQHRQPHSDDNLSTLLQNYTNLIVKDAEDKEEILPGTVYLAPADYHLLVECRNSGESPHFALSTEAAVTYTRPSIDVLFESAADAYAQKVIGVVLTGANHDGTRGLARIKARGGKAIVQEPQTAECQIMPASAIASVIVDKIMPLTDIASFLTQICCPMLL